MSEKYCFAVNVVMMGPTRNAVTVTTTIKAGMTRSARLIVKDTRSPDLSSPGATRMPLVTKNMSTAKRPKSIAPPLAALRKSFAMLVIE